MPRGHLSPQQGSLLVPAAPLPERQLENLAAWGPSPQRPVLASVGLSPEAVPGPASWVWGLQDGPVYFRGVCAPVLVEPFSLGKALSAHCL